MNRKNPGITKQEKLQNRFTAFITICINRARIDYFHENDTRSQYTYYVENEQIALIPDNTTFISNLYTKDTLVYALKKLSDREYYILIAHVLEGKSFDEIAINLDLKYKGVAAIYYRTILKLKRSLGGKFK